jgi:cephalosporin hydroxylase
MTDKEFESKNKQKINSMKKDKSFVENGKSWFQDSWTHEYTNHFSWLGLPIIQLPQDIVALQEIIWKIKPDLIVETGVARGGSVIFHASLLSMIGKGEVIGIDIDIRDKNRKAIEKHPLSKKITLMQGSSISKKIVNQVYKIAKNKKKILVFLDSHHTHNHVLKELELYSPLVKNGSYVVVFDTIVEDLPKNFVKNRPWNVGNNPKTAVHEFLKHNKRFKIDKNLENKLVITSNPDGFLKCIKN